MQIWYLAPLRHEVVRDLKMTTKKKGKSLKIRLDTGIDFSCAFLLTYEETSEKLHGHNFQVALEIEGYLKEDSFVVDYRYIKTILREICKELDEHTLIPTLSKRIKYSINGQNIEFSLDEKKYLIPMEDALLLELPNLTTEMLAMYLCQRIKERIIKDGHSNLISISVEVSEKPGQSAIYSESLAKGKG